ncbi:uncharacterized protein LOC109614917 [Esox lucius]|uniref:Ig-like domain-containing protein n=1 Tax=Esox lucius TaxID=8010 RepID=A0A3P9APB5_ESOLU|nr:uncharacterized protein LOC109614917 [Esox lucius]
MSWMGACMICVIQFCFGAQDITVKCVEPGYNVTINCTFTTTIQFESDDVNWFIHRQAQPPVAILKSYNSMNIHPFCFISDCRQKYSLLPEHKLIIKNVTADDCAVYYCVKQYKGRSVFSNGTRLMTTGNLASENQSILTTNRADEHGALEKTSDFNTMWLKGLLIGSGVWIAFLTGLVSVLWKRAALQKTHDSHRTSDSPGGSDGLEYEVIQLPLPKRPRPDHSATTTYSEVRNLNPE